MTKPIDWDKVDEEFEKSLQKEQAINQKIQEERKTVKTVDDLVNEAKKVNKIIEKNNFDAKILSPKKSDEE